MNVSEIRKHIRARPFHPFRLITTDGGVFEVPHPEFCAIGERIVFVGTEPSKRDPDFPATGQTISPMHISRLEVLDAQQKAQT